jgi:hypothetical protein
LWLNGYASLLLKLDLQLGISDHQGSAADVAMCAMLEIERNVHLKELGWRLLLQVHLLFFIYIFIIQCILADNFITS